MVFFLAIQNQITWDLFLWDNKNIYRMKKDIIDEKKAWFDIKTKDFINVEEFYQHWPWETKKIFSIKLLSWKTKKGLD